MDGHTGRHQQPVGHGRALGLRFLAILLIAAVAICGFIWAWHTDDDPKALPAIDFSQEEEAASPKSVATMASRGAFLGELAADAHKAAADGGNGASAAASASWDEACSLPLVGRDLLRVYQDEPGTILKTSGYLDIKGNVWGAIVAGPAWVDLVTCTATADDAGCRVSIVRLTPGEQAETEGS